MSDENLGKQLYESIENLPQFHEADILREAHISQSNIRKITDFIEAHKNNPNVLNWTNDSDELKRSPLHLACCMPNLEEIVKALVDAPAIDINKRDGEDGGTPLCYAALTKNKAAILELTSHRADLEKAPIKGIFAHMSPLTISILAEYGEGAKILIAKGAKIPEEENLARDMMRFYRVESTEQLEEWLEEARRIIEILNKKEGGRKRRRHISIKKKVKRNRKTRGNRGFPLR